MEERGCLGLVSVGNIVGTTRVEDSLLAIAMYYGAQKRWRM